MEEDPLEVLTPCGMVEIPDPPRVALGALTPEALDLRALLEGTEVDVDGRHPVSVCVREELSPLTMRGSNVLVLKDGRGGIPDVMVSERDVGLVGERLAVGAAEELLPERKI